MKYIVSIEAKLRNLVSKMKDKKGQNTVEYIVMLTIVIVVVAAVGGLMKGYMPDLFDQVKEKISNGVQGM